jgi:hypothetical protein
MVVFILYRIIESCSRYGLGFDSLVCQSSNMKGPGTVTAKMCMIGRYTFYGGEP